MSFLFYLFQLTLYSGLFSAIFCVLLRTIPSHAFNRRFLIAALVLPALMPLLSMPVAFLPDAMQTMPSILLNEVRVGLALKRTGSGLLMNREAVIPAAYLSVAVVLLLRIVCQRRRMNGMLKNAPFLSINNTKVFLLPGFGPGSFNRRIFFPSQEINSLILAHEKAHVQHLHHYDLWLTQFAKALCWINPFIYYLSDQLKMVHEYEADSAVTQCSPDAYAGTLLAEALQVRHISIAHSFFHHPIKNRIIMLQMQQQKLTGNFRIKAIAMAALLLLSATGIIAQTRHHAKPVAGRKPTATNNVYRQVKDMPEFRGDVSEWLGSHLQYPDAARNAGAEGRVIVEFVIAKDGSVSRPKAVRSSSVPSLDAEALRVVKMMPKWNPGRHKGRPVAVYFSLPITFKLEG